MSRDWLLFLDDLIASAQKIGRLTRGLDAAVHHVPALLAEALALRTAVEASRGSSS